MNSLALGEKQPNTHHTPNTYTLQRNAVLQLFWKYEKDEKTNTGKGQKMQKKSK